MTHLTLKLKRASTLKSWLVPLMMLITLTLFSNFSVAQDTPTAAVSAQGIVQLPTDQELSEKYWVEVPALANATDEELVAFFSDKGTDLYAVRANIQAHKGSLLINLSDHPEWTVAQWNEQLAIVSAANPLN